MDADKYIRSIRNHAKREYAVKYWRYLNSDGSDTEPERPSDLGYMGAQAVRYYLDAFFEECK